MIIGGTEEMNETNLAQHFTSKFLIQFVFQENSFIFCFSYV